MRQIVERAPVPAMRRGLVAGGMGVVRPSTQMVVDAAEAPEVVERRLAEERIEAGARRGRGLGARGLRVEGRRPRGWVPLPYSLFERRRVGGAHGPIRSRREMQEATAAAEAGRTVSGGVGEPGDRPRGRAAERVLEVARRRRLRPGEDRGCGDRGLRGIVRGSLTGIPGVQRGSVFGTARAEMLRGEAARGDGGVGRAGGAHGTERRRGGFDAEEELRLELVR